MFPEIATSIGDRIGRRAAPVRALQPGYSWWLRAVYGERGLPWHVNGEPIRIDPRVRHLVPHVVERPLFEFLRANIRTGDVVLDIGAFVGVFTVLEARWAGSQGQVLAFEPFPSSFATLECHLRMNGLAAPRVIARQAAVGAHEERRQLKIFDGEPYRNMLEGAAVAGPPRSAVAVDVVSLDEIRGSFERPPTWIRMDAQGLEFDVLRGARELLRERGNKLRIVVEMHPQLWPAYGIEPREAPNRLAELGLRAKALETGGDPFGEDAHAILEWI